MNLHMQMQKAYMYMQKYVEKGANKEKAARAIQRAFRCHRASRFTPAHAKYCDCGGVFEDCEHNPENYMGFYCYF